MLLCQSTRGISENIDVDQDLNLQAVSGFDFRHIQSSATDFELPDYGNS